MSSDFVAAISPDLKSKLMMFEVGALEIEGKYHIIGSENSDEFNLYKDGLIDYQELPSIMDEKIRRLVTANSILQTLSPDEKEMVLTHRAVILFRDESYFLVSNKLDHGLLIKNRKTEGGSK